MGKEKTQEMITGVHKIRSVSCKKCKTTIGWTYVFAYEESEKYKEGKFIIERAHISKKNRKNHIRNDSFEDGEMWFCEKK